MKSALKNTESSFNKNIFILLGAFLVLVLFHQFGYIGHYGYDDMRYAKLANGWLEGQFNYEDHFTFRTPLLVLSAICYKVFGVSDFSSALPSLIITSAFLILMYNTIKKESFFVVLISLSTTILCNWFLFYSDKLMADIHIAFFIFTAVLAIYRQYFKENSSSILNSFLFACSLLLGFMTKGTILLITPLIIYFFVSDIFLKRNKRFWIYSSLFGILLLLIYFGFIHWLTGDATSRFSAISNNAYINPCSYELQPLNVVLKRISTGFYAMLSNQMLLPMIVLSFAGALVRFKSTLRITDKFAFWTISSVVLVLSSNFFSISFTSYSPMCLDPRHYLFLIPIASISGAVLLEKFINKEINNWLVIGVSIIAMIGSLLLNETTKWWTFIIIPSLLILVSFIQNKNLSKWMLSIGILFLFVLEPIEQIKFAQQVKHRNQVAFIEEEIIPKLKSRDLVIGDEVQMNLLEYYANFPKDIDFIPYQDLNSQPNQSVKLLINKHTHQLAGRNNEDYPYFIKNLGENYQLLAQNEDLGIRFIESSKLNKPQFNSKKTHHFKIDFESKNTEWNYDETAIIKNDTNQFYRVWEYSSSIALQTDSLIDIQSKELFFDVSFRSKFQSYSEAMFIVSLEENGKSYFHKAIPINKFVKAYGVWWDIQLEQSIPIGEMKRGTILKIYLWNKGKKEVYIDDFIVDFYRI